MSSKKDLFAGFLTIQETALLIGRDRRTVYNYIRTGKLEPVQIMGKQYVRLSSVLAHFPQDVANA